MCYTNKASYNLNKIYKVERDLSILPSEDGTTFDGIKTASAISFQIDIFVLVMSGSMKGGEVMLFPLFLNATTWTTENIKVPFRLSVSLQFEPSWKNPQTIDFWWGQGGVLERVTEQ